MLLPKLILPASLRHDVNSAKLKRDIISSIEKLAPSKYKNRDLQRMKKADLKKLLTEVFEQKCHEAMLGADPEDEKSNDAKTAETPEMARKRRDGQMVSEMMYRVMLGGCSMIEYASKRYNGYLGGMCLHQWSQTIDSNDYTRETLRGVCYEVYLEHQESLTALMSKEGRLVCCLLMTACQCARKYSPQLENDVRQFDKNPGPRSGVQPDNYNSGSPEPRQNKFEPSNNPTVPRKASGFNPIVREWRFGPSVGMAHRPRTTPPQLPVD